MNIAMTVRGYLPVPRPADMIYAPIDLAIAIAQGMTQRGHTVDLYAPLGSEVRGVHIETCNLRPLARSQSEFSDFLKNGERLNHYVPSLWDNYVADTMFARARKGQYDLLHFHHPEIALPLSREHADIPVVHTLHDPVYPWYKELFELYDSPNQHFISISNNQRRDAPDLRYAATVYNGIDLDQWAFDDTAEDFLLCAGRIVPEKGFKEAIEVAQATGHRLLIIGPVYPDHQGYFDQYIKPHLNDKILYLGYIEREQMYRYYQKAKAFLMPIQWEEPFGLTVVEAMACGTPVIALRRGAIPEVVKNNKTGFIVNSIAEMTDAVKKIERINRADCRDHVAQNFSFEKMLDGYEAAYEKILRSRKKLTTPYVRSKMRRVVPEVVRETVRETAKKAKPVKLGRNLTTKHKKSQSEDSKK
jgi:glycosyltransferase involved in cell wall biosynthesis